MKNPWIAALCGAVAALWLVGQHALALRVLIGIPAFIAVLFLLGAAMSPREVKQEWQRWRRRDR